ncbi:LysE family translocator [Nisaea acidiphila]|uniref:LysE family translocator n=1 Tax=Nisaea acidiphila TaxID=1862145 RepID=A0A9J7AVJ5_9PROT|nr:LysE family translocator [Nisaea acidiphila]UUX51344.1 LysE family translocator [Nisaea acidiphila]
MFPTLDSVLALLAMAFPLMGSPGPAIVAITANGAAFGIRAGLPFLFGIYAGVFTVLCLTASGVTGLLLALPGVGPVLVMAAVLYMLYLAYRIATAPPPGMHGTDDPDPPGFGAGIVVSLTNVKAYTVFTALYAGNILIESDPIRDTLTKLAILTCVMLFVNGSWLVFGGIFAGFIRSPRIGRAFNITMAILLLVSVALAVIPR